MKELISELEGLGFTNYEAKVFVSLMKGFNMSAPEVAEDSKVPKSSAYDILKIFAERGYCNEIQTPSKIRYEIVAPDIVKGKIENELVNNFDRKKFLLSSSFEKLSGLFKSNHSDNSSSDIELIKGFNLFRFVKFLDLLKEANEEILLMNRLEGQISTELDEETKKFFQRGGRSRSIYEASTNFKLEKDGNWKNVTKEDLIEMCEKFEEQGEEIHLTAKVPQNVAIFDRKIVFTSFVDETKTKNKRTDLIVRNRNYADYMVSLFELNWKGSESVEEFKKKLNN
jgi:sugar-specific transcriptional regulator TrmB